MSLNARTKRTSIDSYFENSALSYTSNMIGIIFRPKTTVEKMHRIHKIAKRNASIELKFS